MSEATPPPSSDSSSPAGRPPLDPRGATLPPPPPPGYFPMYPPFPGAPKQRGIVSRILGGLVASILLISIVANFYLGAMVVAFTSGPSETTWREGDAQHRIVILPIEGMIDAAMADYAHKALDALAKKPPAAIVLRVESGGGSVVASDQIWHALERFKAQHPDVPIVASFGGVAASGGYYVATPAQHILCEQTGVTGSIGVMAQVPTMGGLMDKIGVQWETFAAKGSPRKTIANDMFRQWTDQDRAAVEPFLTHAYERFAQVVREGRPNLTPQQIDAAMTGEAFTATRAKDLGLIDGVGYLDDAVAHAEGLLSLAKPPQVTKIHRPQGFGVGGLLGSRQADLSGLGAEQLTSLLTELATPRLMYAMQWR